MNNYLNRIDIKVLLALASVLFIFNLGLLGFLWYRPVQAPPPSPENTTPPPTVIKPSVILPNEKTAKRCYPGGGNLPDFREDGSGGEFAVSIDRSNADIVLRWDSGIKVSSVEVLALNNICNLTDEKIVWKISNINEKGPMPARILGDTNNDGILSDEESLSLGDKQRKEAEFIAGLPAEQRDKEMERRREETLSSLRLSLLSSPYQIGMVPQGFFNNAQGGDEDAIFQKNMRYTINLRGEKGVSRVSAFYTFDY